MNNNTCNLDQPLGIRLRKDLIIQRQTFQRMPYRVIKDPVNRNYFRFHEEEFAIFEMFDGKQSLRSIQENFSKRFPEQSITTDEILQLIRSANQSGLLTISTTNLGSQLLMRGEQRKQSQRWSKLTSILSIRLKGIDPDAFLDAIYPYCRWLFSFWMLVFYVCVSLSALLLISVQFDQFQAKLPFFHDFFTPANAFWLVVTFAVAKTLHEMGHALVCKHYGCEVHEMGVLFLCLSPCLYCDTTDSWMLPSKWKRMAIGAAGIAVEIVLASIATWLWWFSEPGLFHLCCLNVMFLCSMNTIFFNGNPLLRYDGYYIFADWMEIPNLRRKSQEVLFQTLGSLGLGIQYPEDPFLPKRQRLMFACYAIASTVYRWLMVFSIVWMLYSIFKPYRLEAIGVLLVMFAFSGLILLPIRFVWRFVWRLLKDPQRLIQMSLLRASFSLVVMSGVVYAVMTVPIPHRVRAPIVVDLENASPVYVHSPGKLNQIYASPGKVIVKGQPVLALENPSISRKVSKLMQLRDQQRDKITNLSTERFDSPEQGHQLPAAEEALKSIEQQLKQHQQDLVHLQVPAPMSGIIYAAPSVREPKPSQEKIVGWTKTPLAKENLGTHLQTGTLVCLIGDPAQMEASVLIDQTEIEFVQPGQKLWLQFDSKPGEVLEATISEIAEVDVDAVPKQLSNKVGGLLATHTDSTGKERPINVVYQAKVRVDGNAYGLLPGQTGSAKIAVGSQTCAEVCWRWITHTFHFRL